MEVGVQLHAPATLTKGKGPSPLDRKLGVTQLWPGHGDEEKISLPLPVVYPAAQSLYRPNYLGSCSSVKHSAKPLILFQKDVSSND